MESETLIGLNVTWCHFENTTGAHMHISNCCWGEQKSQSTTALCI